MKLKSEDNPQLAYHNMLTRIQRMRYLDLTKKEIREQQGPNIRFEFYLVFMIFNISSPSLVQGERVDSKSLLTRLES